MPAIVLPDPPLSDQVVALRRWRRSDVPAIAAACRDPEIPRFLSIPEPYTEDDARGWLRTHPGELSAGRSAQLAIAAASGDGLLGAIDLHALDWRHHRAEVGYWVAAPERGRGVATRGVALIARWGFQTLGLARIGLIVDTDNLASQRVAERAGFTREGVARGYMDFRGRQTDMWVFSLLAADVRTRPPPAAEASPAARSEPALTHVGDRPCGAR